MLYLRLFYNIKLWFQLSQMTSYVENNITVWFQFLLTTLICPPYFHLWLWMLIREYIYDIIYPSQFHQWLHNSTLRSLYDIRLSFQFPLITPYIDEKISVWQRFPTQLNPSSTPEKVGWSGSFCSTWFKRRSHNLISWSHFPNSLIFWIKDNFIIFIPNSLKYLRCWR